MLSGPVIYYLGGAQQNGQRTRRVEYAEVNADGTLTPWTTTANMQRSREGYVAALANNSLVTAGGQNGAPSSTADKGELCDGMTCQPPAVDQWSSLANVDLRDRVWAGDVTFNGFLYVCGGQGPAGTTDTIDYSPLGGTP